MHLQHEMKDLNALMSRLDQKSEAELEETSGEALALPTYGASAIPPELDTGFELPSTARKLRWRIAVQQPAADNVQPVVSRRKTIASGRGKLQYSQVGSIAEDQAEGTGSSRSSTRTPTSSCTT